MHHENPSSLLFDYLHLQFEIEVEEVMIEIEYFPKWLSD
jgi:hypothetical protein